MESTLCILHVCMSTIKLTHRGDGGGSSSSRRPRLLPVKAWPYGRHIMIQDSFELLRRRMASETTEGGVAVLIMYKLQCINLTPSHRWDVIRLIRSHCVGCWITALHTAHREE